MTRAPLAIALAAFVSAAQGAAQPQGIDRLSWMRGCWEQVAGGGTVEEQWMAPKGGSMLGMSRTVGRSRLLEYEFIVIRGIGYELTSPDRLLAWIEGPRDGQVRRVEFRYTRAACAGR